MFGAAKKRPRIHPEGFEMNGLRGGGNSLPCAFPNVSARPSGNVQGGTAKPVGGGGAGRALQARPDEAAEGGLDLILLCRFVSRSSWISSWCGTGRLTWPITGSPAPSTCASTPAQLWPSWRSKWPRRTPGLNGKAAAAPEETPPSGSVCPFCFPVAKRPA